MRTIFLSVLLAVWALPASAQSGPWGDSALRDRYRSDSRDSRFPERTAHREKDSREGQVSSAHFAAEGAAQMLGAGVIAVTTLPDSALPVSDRLTFEAATIDRLVQAGYDTLNPLTDDSQIAEIRVKQDIAEPAEVKRSPMSGEGSVMVSNRGTAVGMAIGLDFTKPRTALISTRMDLQIKHRTTGAVLWEARAEMFTRKDDPDWSAERIANRLAGALFEEFPAKG